MRNRKTQGFTLIELLIVIAIIGILAAVLIPNLLNARQRAFDTSAQTCARSTATWLEASAVNSPFTYSTTGLTKAEIGSSCPAEVALNVAVASGGTGFTVQTRHSSGRTSYQISNGTGVTPITGNPAVTNNVN